MMLKDKTCMLKLSALSKMQHWRGGAVVFLWLQMLLLAANVAARTSDGLPVIKEQPQSAVVRRNDPYTLYCAADKATQIKWYHNGEMITDISSEPTSHRMLLPNGALFFLRVASSKKNNDAGTYWCVAFNSEGATRSQNATIEVASIEDEFVDSPQSLINIIEGEPLVLPCRPPKGNPEPKVTWLRDGAVLRNDSRVYGTSSGDLRFRMTKPEDSGIYECQASNAAGTKKSSASSISIMSPPRFEVAPKNRTVTTGTTISLPCKVIGNPPPKVDWVRLDGKIPLKRASVSEDYTLHLTQVTASDSGHYKCIAESEAGSIKADVHIEVLALPFISAKPSDQVLKVGTSKRLPCDIGGDPTPLLLWRLPGDDPSDILLLEDSKGHMKVRSDGSLMMENISLQDSGLYTCMATNSGGGVSARAKILSVEAFPPPVVGIAPEDLVISDGDTITLPCEPVSEAAEPTISWWFKPAVHLPETQMVTSDNNDIVISSNGALTIKNANRSNSGIYTCKVTAETGSAEATAVVRHEEKTLNYNRINSILPAPPSKPRVRVINDTSVRLSWQPNSSVIGKKNPMTYMIEYWRHGWSEWRIAASYIKSGVAVISELSPNYTYTFFVRSVTGSGQSFPSPWSNPIRLEVLTNNAHLPRNRWLTERRIDRPTVALISARAGSSRSVLLTWQGLGDENQEDGVLVYWISHEDSPDGLTYKPSKVKVATVLGSSSSSHLVRGLEPYTHYTFFLVPFWRSVEGTPTNSLSLRTPEDIPSAAPQSVLLSRRSATEALVTWDEVDSGDIPGRLLGYAVVTSCNGSVTDYNVTTPWLEINNLLPGCLLTTRVAAMTNIGIGPFSSPALLQMSVDESSPIVKSVPSVDHELLATPHHMWLVYVLLPILMIIIVGLVLYLKGFIRCHKSPDRHSHTDKCRDHSVCSSHCHVNMYGEQHKTWSATDTPRIQPNSCLLRHNHYVNDYAEPNNLLVSDASQVEAYTTTALMAPTSPLHELPGPGQWTAFLPPPPPSCPPPPLGQYSGSEGTTCSSHSSSDSYNRGYQNRQLRRMDPCPDTNPIYYKRPCDEASEHTYEAYNHRSPMDAYSECLKTPQYQDNAQHYSPPSSNSSSHRGRGMADSLSSQGAATDGGESIPLRKSPVEDTFPTFSSLHAASSAPHRSEQRL